MSKTLHTLLVAFLAILALLSSTAAVPVANTAKTAVVIHRRASTSSPCGNSTHCKLLSSTSKHSAGAYKLIAPGAKARPHPKRDDEELQRRLIGLITTQIRTTTVMSVKTITSRATSMKTITTTVPRTTVKVTTISGTRRTLTMTTASRTVRITPVITMRTTVTTVPVVKTNVVTITRPFSSTVSRTTSTSRSTTISTTTTPRATTTSSVSRTTTSVIPTATPTVSALKAAELDMLNRHNMYRARHGAPALTWDNNLAAFAATWANKCIWAHSGGPYGENGASSVGMDMTMADSVAMWYGEILDYNFLQPDFSYATGHFTQLVWKDTTTVGCAIATCTPSQLGYNWPYPDPAYNVWCEYSKNPGNVIGEFAQNVLQPNNLPVIGGFVPSL
ncbi:hypothetical protein A4X09_0g4679 [Tilletia walkeri]|uniref:SCP domain-containing protein n=1 Tax=Tilletia walkeri TaxID=117179 RepID=A0A8X7N5S5_9BASI|nr:hypothetical protein A4X09_0g4679 [Tilletia walkeri]